MHGIISLSDATSYDKQQNLTLYQGQVNGHNEHFFSKENFTCPKANTMKRDQTPSGSSLILVHIVCNVGCQSKRAKAG